MKPDAVAVGIVCAYELAGLSKAVPTITNLTMRLPRGGRAVVVVLASLWLAKHLEVI